MRAGDLLFAREACRIGHAFYRNNDNGERHKTRAENVRLFKTIRVGFMRCERDSQKGEKEINWRGHYHADKAFK